MTKAPHKYVCQDLRKKRKKGGIFREVEMQKFIKSETILKIALLIFEDKSHLLVHKL